MNSFYTITLPPQIKYIDRVLDATKLIYKGKK